MLIITLYSGYDEFEMTTTPVLYLGNKDLEEIQLIVIFTKLVNLAKRAISIIADLAMMARKKRPLQQTPWSRPNGKCFNYGKKSHYAKDYPGCINPKKKLGDKKIK